MTSNTSQILDEESIQNFQELKFSSQSDIMGRDIHLVANMNRMSGKGEVGKGMAKLEVGVNLI